MKTNLRALGALFAVGCGGYTSTATPASKESSPATELVVASTPGSAERRLATARRTSWTVSFEGAAPLVPGMTLRESVIAMEGDLFTHDTSLRCSYFRAARAPGLRFLFLNRVLARIEVESGTTATVEGVRIGTTEDRVKAAYRGRVSVTVDQHTNNHYLAVSPPDASDTTRRIVFETDGRRVLRYRTGLRPAVDQDAGCS